MVDAGDLADVLDVVGDLVDRRVGLGVRPGPVGGEPPERDEVPGVDAHLRRRRGGLDAPLRVAGETNSGTKVTMQTPPLAGSAASTSSGTLRGVSQGPGPTSG